MSKSKYIRKINTEKIFDKPEFHSAWCIFDKDDYPDFDDAIKLAKSKDIKFIFSNQAFELWFLMHFEPRMHPLHRDNYKEKIEKYLGTDIGKKPFKNRDQAIENARRIYQLWNKEYFDTENWSTWESCTSVWLLVDWLKQWRLRDDNPNSKKLQPTTEKS